MSARLLPSSAPGDVIDGVNSDMSREPACWSPDAVSATVLMEYLKHASPQFVAAELDKLGLLNAADDAAEAVFEKIAMSRASNRVDGHAGRFVAVMALAMCAMIVVVAQTRHLGVVLPEDNGSQFMQLAGPTPEW
jgi:hypothetical protein